ncbi:hypothetical protein CHUAL_013666 [Chamberlinius hualienensis]
MRLNIIVITFYLTVYYAAGVKWFYIENLRPEPDGSYLVVDVDNDIVRCPGAKLIVCPRKDVQQSQQWRWQSRMLINKANNMAIDVKCDASKNNSLPLIVFYPTNSTNQRWLRDGKFIVSEVNDNVMGLDPSQNNGKSLAGIRLRLYNKGEQESLRFRLVVSNNY